MDEYKGPVLKLGTMIMAIQAIDQLMHEMGTKPNSVDDELFYLDLSLAADDLEETYKSHIEKTKIINAPAYDKLVRKKD